MFSKKVKLTVLRRDIHLKVLSFLAAMQRRRLVLHPCFHCYGFFPALVISVTISNPSLDVCRHNAGQVEAFLRI